MSDLATHMLTAAARSPAGLSRFTLSQHCELELQFLDRPELRQLDVADKSDLGKTVRCLPVFIAAPYYEFLAGNTAGSDLNAYANMEL